MASWWKMTPEELADSPDEQLEKQIDYYNVFFGSARGRRVLADIRNMCYDSSLGEVELVALICLYRGIRMNAGGGTRETEKAMIDAEAKAIQIGLPSGMEDAEDEDLLEIE